MVCLCGGCVEIGRRAGGERGVAKVYRRCRCRCRRPRCRKDSVDGYRGMGIVE